LSAAGSKFTTYVMRPDAAQNSCMLLQYVDCQKKHHPRVRFLSNYCHSTGIQR
jgi:hypothetical protein